MPLLAPLFRTPMIIVAILGAKSSKLLSAVDDSLLNEKEVIAMSRGLELYVHEICIALIREFSNHFSSTS